MRSNLSAAIAVVMLAAGSTGALAGEVQIKMLNKGTEGIMVFEPALVKIQPGDTVRFVASDKGHNVESIEGMLPEGAKAFASKVNEELTITFDQAGVYGYKCKPHYAMGMVGLVVVGDAVNADQAKEKSHPGKAKQTFANLFTNIANAKTASR
jgi:pseudoazurin